MFGKRFLAIALSSAVLGLTACQYTEGRETQTGAVVGGLAGAGLGAVIGHQTGDAGAGALIGGATGALLGGGIGYAIENQRKQFERELENVQVSQQQYQGRESIVLTMGDQVLFEFGSAALTPNAMQTLDQVVAILQDPQYQLPSRVIVSGHTDNVGSDSANQYLSQRRAEAVRNYLVSRGINPGIVSAQGMGESMPIAPNDTASNRALNRRVEIQIIP